MDIETICTKDPKTCAFGTLAQNVPEMLIVLREQRAVLCQLLDEGKDTDETSFDGLLQLKMRSNVIIYRLMKWAKRIQKEAAKCQTHQKH